MTSIDQSLAEARREVDDFIQSTNHCADCWTTPRAPGKWSPSQVLEHVARSFDAGAGDVRGARSGLPDLPRFVRPVVRTFLFNRVLRSGTFPRARTNTAMNPLQGPQSPAEGIARLESSWSAFCTACTEAAAGGGVAKSRVFGDVPVADYVRFQGFHTRHHRGQMRGP